MYLHSIQRITCHSCRALFPCGDSLVCIIDDREDVWNFSPNLIPVKPYHFFSQIGDINAPFGLEKSVQRQEYQPEEETSSGEKRETVGRRGFPNIRDIFESDDGKIEPITPVASEGEDEKQDVCYQARNDTAKTEQKEKSTAIDAVTLNNKLVHCQVEDTEKMEESHTVEDSVPNKDEDIIDQNKDEVIEERKCLKDQIEDTEGEKMKESRTVDNNVPNKEKEIGGELIQCLKDQVEVVEAEQMDDNICPKMSIPIVPENKDNEVDKINCLKHKVEDAKVIIAEENQTVKDSVTQNKGQVEELDVSGLRDKVVICSNESPMAHPEKSVIEKQTSGTESLRPKLTDKETNHVKECIEKMLDVTVLTLGECNVDKSAEEIKETAKSSNGTTETVAEEISAQISDDGCNNCDSETVDDSDDYLFYLEEILTMIHQAFYDMYDQMKAQKRNEIPDLKTVIPYVQRKVLKGTNVVLSGLIPTNAEVEKSKLWILAKSLGAIVTKDLNTKPKQSTTHVVAAKLGTAKVNKARRMKGIHIVNPDWLYCCAERWEHVDERLFPLRDGIVYKKHPYRSPSLESQMQRHLKQALMPGQQSDTAASGEPCPVYDPVTGKRIRQQIQVKGNTNHRASKPSGKCTADKEKEERFSESFSPLLSFSTAEIEQMGKEVDDACSEDSNNVDDSDSSDEKIPKPKNSGSDSSTRESLSGGECPKGWKKRKRDAQDEGNEKFGGVIFCEDDVPQTKCKRREFPTDSENSSKSNSEEDGESIGSVDEEMAAAVEREFLSC